MTDRVLDVRGAAEHNLHDVDVVFGSGLTAVVGPSGSGKSSLVFDVVYAEAHRRFLESLALGRARVRLPAPRVRHINGLGPAVAVAQNVLNVNPASLVATSVGVHPFFRILYARFAEVSCPRCDTPVRAVSQEERLSIALRALASAGAGSLAVEVALARRLRGRHVHLLSGLRGRYEAVRVDGRPWAARPSSRIPRLDAAVAHDVTVTVATLGSDASAAEVRAALERADGLGSHEVRLGGRPLLRAPICPDCGDWVRPLEPSAFRPGGPDTSSHLLAGLALPELLARSVDEVLGFVEQLPDGLATRLRDELQRRLRPLQTLGLGHLALDRPMPTLSRGEAQRTRLAVVLAGRLEDLLHVLDEPTIGLHHTDRERLLDAIASLPGPVLMVEHDPTAVAMADDVVEIGPGGGSAGGQLVFQGTPASLWRADTASGRGFSATTAGSGRSTDVTRRALGPGRIHVGGAHLRNLRGVDCSIPLGAITVITGPSGAGKTTLARDVLFASLRAGEAVGCATFEAPKMRVLAVDQSPLGKNPRSNPATYTKVFDRIREVFAAETGRSSSSFTFNRPEGACPECEGMGSIEIAVRFVPSAWVACEACEGRRYRPEVLDATWKGRSIAAVLACSVEEARELFPAPEHAPIARTLDTLLDVGLGYLTLGQPSPSLSGGEAQRVRLAREVAKVRPGDLLLLDEPTTGLHPGDLDRLLAVLHRLADNGGAVVVVEHQAELIAAADWQVDLGPGGGPEGGRLQHCGVVAPEILRTVQPRTEARPGRRTPDVIQVRGARAHNLQDVDVDLSKRRFTVVTGVSGSGKSSLVDDVIAAEASRRLLESLSVYERQSVREGPEAPVDAITGLGPTMVIDASTTIADPIAASRASVGRATELDRLLGIVLARSGVRTCSACGGENVQRDSSLPERAWTCLDCGDPAVPIEPRHLVGSPTSLCTECLGRGFDRRLRPDKVVRAPDKPICGGCFGSGGLMGWFCDESTGGWAALRALADRHEFDPKVTSWSEMGEGAQQAFLFGEPGRTNEFSRTAFVGLNYWARLRANGGDDVDTFPCPACGGKGLRPPYLAIRLAGHDRTELFTASLGELHDLLSSLGAPADPLAAEARTTALQRLGFLRAIGLGYLHLDRSTWTLSAGEAQRIKLASVLGAGLVGMTVLLDEPSRGLHPTEVVALVGTLVDLRDAGNTVVAVEHDPTFIRAADEVIEIGPGAGRAGGRVVDVQSLRSVTRDVLSGRVAIPQRADRRTPEAWMTVHGAREHNLRELDVRIPLGVQVGVCGVSGSGKSSLVVDTLAMTLAPPRSESGTGVVRTERGDCDRITGAPGRVVAADQSRAAITSPGMFLGLIEAVRKEFGNSEAVVEQGVSLRELVYGCDACRGKGSTRESMWFLPSVTQTCDACDGTGYRREIAGLVERGRTLSDIEGLTIGELVDEWGDLDVIRRVGDAALALGLDYLIVRQPGWSLSGGEAQRLKLAKELARRTKAAALYVLDEPTVGLQATDVAVLARALDAVVEAGNTVLVVEHDPALLATCDWLIELGPGAGPDGGRIIFEGTPEALAAADTPTAPFVSDALT